MKLIYILLFTFISFGILGQTAQTYVFMVSSSHDGEAISYAKFSDRTNNTQYISNDDGIISLSITDSTLIKISSIGYHAHYFFNGKDSDTLQIKLKPKIYELDEYVVSPYPTIALFKRAFEDMEFEDTSVLDNNLAPIYLVMPKMTRSSYNSQEIVSFSFSSPISAFYNLYSKDAKSRQRLRQLKSQDIRYARVYKKYNPKLVQAITGIDNEDELDELLDFCDPSDSFILAATDYEIAAYILNCYKDYKVNR